MNETHTDKIEQEGIADAFGENAKLADNTSKNRQYLSLCWHGVRIGNFETIDGEMKWLNYAEPKYENLFSKRPEDGMPYFLVNMHPDNKLFELLDQDDQVTYITSGLRFLSNLVISKNCPYDNPVKIDTLQTDFSRYISDGTFSGIYTGPFPKDKGEGVEEGLKEYWRNRYVPRFSGAEMKVPATLHEYGVLQPAITTSFTHIIKFPTGNCKEGWGFNEWMCLELSEAAGLKTASHALLPLGDDAPPALLVERFDIPRHTQKEDHNWLLIQDFCTLADLGPEDRGKGSLEQIAKIMRRLSSNSEADIEDFYRRAILSIALNDGDMHRKNISMLFEYNPEKNEYVNVRMSPAYDITSEIWQYDIEKRQTLSIQGKDSGFKAKTLVDFAKSVGIPEPRAKEILEETSRLIAERAVAIAQQMPKEAEKHDCCRFVANRIATLAVKNAILMGAPSPDWQNVEAPKTSVSIIEGGKRLTLRHNPAIPH